MPLDNIPVIKPSHYIFSVKDVRTGLFMTPFYNKTLPGAIRDVSSVVADPKSMLARHPLDYQLYRIGSWHEEVGYIDATENPELLCEIQSLIPKAEVPNA